MGRYVAHGATRPTSSLRGCEKAGQRTTLTCLPTPEGTGSIPGAPTTRNPCQTGVSDLLPAFAPACDLAPATTSQTGRLRRRRLGRTSPGGQDATTGCAPIMRSPGSGGFPVVQPVRDGWGVAALRIRCSPDLMACEECGCRSVSEQMAQSQRNERRSADRRCSAIRVL